MAKKVPLLGPDYNPVGSRLQRITSDEDEQESGRKGKGESSGISTSRTRAFNSLMEKEAMTAELRCRCTRSERRKWHEFAQRMTGEPNRLSSFLRAMLLLLEHADPQLQQLRPILEQLVNPPKSDSMAMILYERRLAELVWEALRRAGKPLF